MKLSLFIICLTVFSVTATETYSQATKLSLFMKNISISKVLREIEDQSEFRFFYSEDVDTKKIVSVNFKESNISDILDEIFKETPIIYKIVGRQVALYNDTKDEMLFPGVQQQPNQIKGKVTDFNRQPLPGVTVVIKGTTDGTVTDANGEYTLTNIPRNAIMLFTFVGMKAQEIMAEGKTTINVVMEEETIGLEEVVAIGYGTMKKSDLTGSIVSVSADDIKNRPITTIGQALQGKASGIMVRTNSAAPGSKTTVNIRGQNSINSDSSPLYIVDGLPIDDISYIAPEEIQSIEVLKDGSSTAIYGSRGANGVILITTKKGVKGKTKITYSFRTSLEHLSHDFNLMNANEFTNIYTEWEKTVTPNIETNNLWFNGSSQDRPLPKDTGEGTNWFKEVTRNGMMNNHRINISGGSETNIYSISLHYLDHKGVVLGSSYNRTGINVSNQLNITRWLDAGIDAFVTSSNKNNSQENVGIMSGTGTQSVIHEATKMSPATPVYTEDGKYFGNTLPSSATLENPVATAKEVDDVDKDFNVFGKLYFDFNPIENLNIRISGGVNKSNDKFYFYNPKTTIYGGLKGGEAELRQSSTNYLNNENTVSYTNVFKEVHKLDILAGFTYEKETNESFSNSATGFFTDFYKYNNLALQVLTERLVQIKTSGSWLPLSAG